MELSLPFFDLFGNAPFSLILAGAITSEDVAPWWAVPVITGGSLVLGGLLTFLLGKWNDGQKATRERDALWNAEILEKGAALIAAGDELHQIALLTLIRNPEEAMLKVTERGLQAVDAFQTAVRMFSMVMPIELDEPMKKYAGWSALLLMPPLEAVEQEKKLKHQSEAADDLIDAFRAIRLLKPLDRKTGSIKSISNSARLSMSMNTDGLIRYRKRQGHQAGSPPENLTEEETSPQS